MVEFDNPLADYESHFRETHERLAREYFEMLLQTSQVDKQQNLVLVSEIQKLNQSHNEASATRRKWKFIRILLLVLALAPLLLLIEEQNIVSFMSIPFAVGIIVLMFKKVNPKIANLNAILTEVAKQQEIKTAEAWTQMAPLNALFTWDIASKLFQQAFPQVRLDRHLDSTRLADLHFNYGLSPNFNDDRSVLYTQSGAYLNNPFVFVRTKQHWIGSRTYSGSITIFWTESVQNNDGDWVEVQRSQVLTASVTKPFPEYLDRTHLIYGHESAPQLSFSRTPSKLSGLDEGMMNNWLKEKAVKKVEKQARRDVKSGDGQLTVMANRDFEALFNAVDRDHEIEFRLLFSPLAQQEMVKLLNDKQIAFGDDFAFYKSGKVNIIDSGHLSETQFHCDPRMFVSFDLMQMQNFFLEYQRSYFKSLFFAFAPLLTIPLYREKRSSQIPAHDDSLSDCSPWDSEMMANYIGEQTFMHPESITQNIIRTGNAKDADGSTLVNIAAYGYKGIPQVDIITMLGGDGNFHHVPVHWTEYVPVSRNSSMIIWTVQNNSVDPAEDKDAELVQRWNESMQRRGIDANTVYVRNGIAARVVN